MVVVKVSQLGGGIRYLLGVNLQKDLKLEDLKEVINLLSLEERKGINDDKRYFGKVHSYILVC